MLLVVTVESNVKFHLLQEGTNQSIVVNVFRSINHKAEVEDLTEVEDLVEEVQVEEVDLTEDHEKCTRQLVEIVVRNVKFHSNQKEISQSIAANVFKVIKEIKNNETSYFIRS